MQNPKYVNVEGVRTRYYEGGSGSPLVLIHGGRFGNFYSADHWSLNFAELCASFHVYAFDKLGQGFTDNPKSDADYTMKAVIAHAYGFMRDLGIEGATLIGHSRGALPAARIAVDHPEMVKGLVILVSSTLAADDPCVPMDFYSKLEENAPAVADREYVSREAVANSFSRDHVTDDFVEAMLRIALLPKTLEAKKRLPHVFEARFLPDVRKTKYETLDLLRDRGLKVPTLLIWGLNDISAPIKIGLDLFHLIGSAVDRAEFHALNRSGHYTFRERAPEVNRLVASFVGGL